MRLFSFESQFLARPARASEICGWSPAQLRELRKRELVDHDAEGGWSHFDIRELAHLSVARQMHLAGMQLSKAVTRASDGMIVSAVVFHAAMERGALVDETRTRQLATNKGLRLKAAMELAAGKENGVISGPLFIWGPSIEASCYQSLDHAREEAERGGNAPVVLYNVIDLREAGKLLCRRVGAVLAIVRDSPTERRRNG